MIKEAILIDGKYHADLILEKLKKNIEYLIIKTLNEINC